jgi:hypothetical protein
LGTSLNSTPADVRNCRRTNKAQYENPWAMMLEALEKAVAN